MPEKERHKGFSRHADGAEFNELKEQKTKDLWKRQWAEGYAWGADGM